MTNFEKVKEMCTLADFSNGYGICSAVSKLRNEENCKGRKCEKCYKWLAQEYKPQILDDVEREYLSTVIKPFRDKAEYITKYKNGKQEQICIDFDDTLMYFPLFPENLMYKNMELNRIYSLKELGL